MQPLSGQWFYTLEHGQPCQVVEALKLWDRTTYRVWLPESDSIVRVGEGEIVLLPLNWKATQSNSSAPE
jgi:hypothetical protein